MYNTLIALILSVFIGSASGVAYFANGQHQDQLAAIQSFISSNPTTGPVNQAPELNTTSGANTIALLVGGLLLAGERFRSRRL